MAYVTCKGLTYAKVASGGDGSAISYTGGVAKTDYLCKVDMGEDRNEVKEFADGHQIDSEKILQQVTLALELAEVDSGIKNDILGHVTEGTGASAYKKVTGADAPFIGVGFILCDRFKGVETFEAYWYYKMQFASGGKSVQTRQEQTSFQHETLNGTGLGIKQSASQEYPDFIAYVDGLATEAAARTWLNTQANISSGSGGGTP